MCLDPQVNSTWEVPRAELQTFRSFERQSSTSFLAYRYSSVYGLGFRVKCIQDFGYWCLWFTQPVGPESLFS